MLGLLSYFSLLLSLIACDSPEPATTPSVCYLTATTEQVTRDTPPTLTLERSFTYTGNQLTAINERTASQQASYRVDYQDGKAVRAVGSPANMVLEYDTKTGRVNRATMAQGTQTQSVFTLTHTASGRLSSLTETRQVPVTGSSVVSRAYSFSYTNAGNVSTERVTFTFQNGSTLTQETDYAVGAESAPYATFPERALLTLVSLGQQFETRPGRLWNANVLTGYQVYTLNGTNRLLAESATFTNQFDATGNLTALTQNTRSYTPAGSTFFTTKPTSHVLTHECR
ncbi:MAG: hypothetical protein H7Z72_12615 [Bacteroidetes bacterium]|nr:hypothetical protein [Fibrella sp.]